MTDYPSIKPEDVREGDVVEVVRQLTVGWQLARTLPHLTDDCYVAGEPVPVTQLRLVSRPTPPEPPVRALLAGDWVRHHDGDEWQITSIERTGNDTYAKGLGSPFPGTGWAVRSLTRIEPPVGWPVGVPTEDGTRWYVRDSPFGNYKPTTPERDNREWADLLAAGGVPALAVTR